MCVHALITSDIQTIRIPFQNDDDWVSVEEEKKDYSGLKIGTLKIDDKEGEGAEEEHEINEEGERVPVKKPTGDVWAQRRNEQNASKGSISSLSSPIHLSISFSVKHDPDL